MTSTLSIQLAHLSLFALVTLVFNGGCNATRIGSTEPNPMGQEGQDACDRCPATSTDQPADVWQDAESGSPAESDVPEVGPGPDSMEAGTELDVAGIADSGAPGDCRFRELAFDFFWVDEATDMERIRSSGCVILPELHLSGTPGPDLTGLDFVVEIGNLSIMDTRDLRTTRGITSLRRIGDLWIHKTWGLEELHFGGVEMYGNVLVERAYGLTAIRGLAESRMVGTYTDALFIEMEDAIPRCDYDHVIDAWRAGGAWIPGSIMYEGCTDCPCIE